MFKLLATAKDTFLPHSVKKRIPRLKTGLTYLSLYAYAYLFNTGLRS